MKLTEILFFGFGAVALVSALLAVTRQNAVASALWLVVMFFGLAGNYVVLEAFFVGAVQVLVYAGAIMVLFLFVIMLLDLRQEALEGQKTPVLRFFGGLAAVLFVIVSVFAVIDADELGLLRQERTITVRVPAQDADGNRLNTKGEKFREGDEPKLVERPKQIDLVDQELDGSARAIALQLFTRWLLAFEVTSILLLGAILGAVILTKRRLT